MKKKKTEESLSEREKRKGKISQAIKEAEKRGAYEISEHLTSEVLRLPEDWKKDERDIECAGRRPKKR